MQIKVGYKLIMGTKYRSICMACWWVNTRWGSFKKTYHVYLNW
jgi:predicted metal-dependent hydrolase